MDAWRAMFFVEDLLLVLNMLTLVYCIVVIKIAQVRAMRSGDFARFVAEHRARGGSAYGSALAFARSPYFAHPRKGFIVRAMPACLLLIIPLAIGGAVVTRGMRAAAADATTHVAPP